ncbi:MAG: hypothetical protein CM15mP93_00300 [Thiotrichaceae bacterium]|nr:MAG: hypothetical protein CM15mP93_00300 [Thiotrichaceae bacterium]
MQAHAMNLNDKEIEIIAIIFLVLKVTQSKTSKK